MNRFGRAGRLALNPQVVVEFLDQYTALGMDPRVSQRPYRTLNGLVLDQNTDGRIIRRWRSVARGATVDAVDHLLRRYNMDLRWLVRWAKLHRRELTLRQGGQSGNRPGSK